jgi:hypothetical protein
MWVKRVALAFATQSRTKNSDYDETYETRDIDEEYPDD